MSKTANPVMAILDRMVEAKLGEGAHFESHALALKIPHNTIRTWARRGYVPLEELKFFSETYKVTIDWLLYGDKPEAVQSHTHQVNEQASTYGLSKDETEILENYRQCRPTGRRALLASSVEMALAAKAAPDYKPRLGFGVGAQPGKVLLQAGQNKPPLMSGKTEPRRKKTKKEDE